MSTWINDDQGSIDNVPADGLGGFDLARDLREKMGDKGIIAELHLHTWTWVNQYDQIKAGKRAFYGMDEQLTPIGHIYQSLCSEETKLKIMVKEPDTI